MIKKAAQKETVQQDKDIFVAYSPKKSAQDTGSPESQIAQFTFRIKSLTTHLKVHKKDKDSLQKGLKKMVGKRKRLLTYLLNKKNQRYQNIIQSLAIKGIR
jgi:small subunit ribosomal protein S15